MAYRYRPAITCVNLRRATVAKAKSLDSPKNVKKRTHCRELTGGITPVGHGYERSTQEDEMLAGRGIKLKEEELLHLA